MPVCPECGKDRGQAWKRLADRASWSFLWQVAVGVGHFGAAAAAGVIGRDLDVFGFVLAGIGVGLVLAVSGLLCMGRPGPGVDARPYFAARIAWSRGAALLGLPLLAGHCGTMLFPAVFRWGGGVIAPYWTSEPEARQILEWMRHGVSVAVVVAVVWGVCALWASVRLCADGRKRRLLLLALPFAFLLLLSAVGGWGLLMAGEMRDLSD